MGKVGKLFPDKEPTKPPQTTHENTTEEPLQKYHIRLAEKDWKALQRYFRAKGLTTSAGIRMVIRDFMNRERIT